MIVPFLLSRLPQILAAAAVVGCLWFAYSWAYGRGEDAERARWQVKVEDAARAYADAAARQQAVIDDLTGQLAEARKRSGGVRQRLQEAIRNDPEVQEWAAVPVPAGVRRLLQPDGRDDLPANSSQPD